MIYNPSSFKWNKDGQGYVYQDSRGINAHFDVSLLTGQEINRSLYNYSKLEVRVKALTNGVAAGKISISVIGKTHGGRDLLCVKFTGESAAAGGREKRILIIGGTDSLEWPGYEAGVRFAETLASNMKAGVKPYSTVYIVPAVNPATVSDYMQYIPKPYYNARKNLGFSPSEKNPRVYTQGVDINRNFPVGWKFQSSPYSVFYAGAKPGSEPETRAVMDLTRPGQARFRNIASLPRKKASLSLGTKDKINYPALAGTCEEFAKRIGYGYRSEQDYTNYPKYGDEIDWFYGELHIPCFRLEMARDLITYTFEEYGGVEKALFWLINEKLKS